MYIFFLVIFSSVIIYLNKKSMLYTLSLTALYISIPSYLMILGTDFTGLSCLLPCVSVMSTFFVLTSILINDNMKNLQLNILSVSVLNLNTFSIILVIIPFKFVLITVKGYIIMYYMLLAFINVSIFVLLSVKSERYLHIRYVVIMSIKRLFLFLFFKLIVLYSLTPVIYYLVIHHN